ncbi:flagellar assembly protein FliH [Evansella vedderi]|uniref:Flagellar assembly protein FliH n=1 Tax=Evansella vedderi TaxID=38282 RepID=A0ABT9ZR94_9BACI|nr:flagellar assembly protein FliH [Evansella vedderi]MDQ0253714.1 flagellar assembly protein FliH [Evansella vedderi]
MSRLIRGTYETSLKKAPKTINLRTVGQKEKGYGSRESTQEKVNVEESVHYIEQRLAEAELEASKIIEKARNQAEKMQEELLQQEDELKKEYEARFLQGEMEGRKQGYEAGSNEAKLAYENEIKKATEIVEKAREDYYKHLESSEPVMIDLAIEVAKKIIGTTLNEKHEAWLHLVKDAVAEVRGQEEIKIYIHPDNYELTLQHQEELRNIALHTRELFIYPNIELKETDCIVETPFGQVEASVDSQLREVKLALFNMLREGKYHDGEGINS